jgi:uncharacterized protein (TIGR02466 family)
MAHSFVITSKSVNDILLGQRHQEQMSMSTNSPSKEIQISRLFSTPLASYRLKDAEVLNRGLSQIILEMERQMPSTGRSNFGGWRSADNLLDWKGDEIEPFAAELRHAVGQLIGATSGEKDYQGRLTINAWANLLRRGNYNSLHNHPESVWSGVYYVDIGTPDSSNPLSGILEFMDPRPFVEMVATPGRPFGRPVRIQAENGLMVLFPSWLYHQVHLYTGDRARIAIAFNVSTQEASTVS